ncbi:T9SS type B sorting domain-containing protein [Flavobacterium sp. Sd200]|uniref:T9SS type B sorting domain-containing protein n=1 Tax=Flavobacterium sp. Sd200 TaxID=2692211 RepID=UPI00136E1CAB|nr:T9SS type B sorting domain-containing protein [Flavobacterium sp. Sd200]MXN90896.1 T9SS type B sorting domain-containing protein [Flavobacterium sp. Sd200]
MKSFCQFLFLFLLLFVSKVQAQITLSHNLGNVLIGNYGLSCSGGDVYFARTFTLQDFGINRGDEFVINSGNIGLRYRNTDSNVRIVFNIYAIYSNFPASFSELDLIGSSQEVEVSGSDALRIVTVNFAAPVTVPAYTERILVEVHQLRSSDFNAAIFCADTAEDNDLSWYKNGVDNTCTTIEYTNHIDLNRLRSKFYITVNGQLISAGPYLMDVAGNCSDMLKNFSLTNQHDIVSVSWDFGDLSSGSNNTSSSLNTSHNFTAPGVYQVVATVINVLGEIKYVRRNVQVIASPVANPLPDVFACQDDLGSGFSGLFDTSGIVESVLGSQTRKVVTFYDLTGALLPSPLPNPMTNTEAFNQVITARVANVQDMSCYAETTFNLVVMPKPNAYAVSNKYVCDDDNDGFAAFDLSTVESDVLGEQTGMTVSYFSNGEPITSLLNTNFINTTANLQSITARVTSATGCFAETIFSLSVQPPPVANAVGDIMGCDDDGDGISEYFDTSGIVDVLLGNQQDVTVDFYDVSGNILPALSNPYTNTIPFVENITARVTNLNTGCYSDTVIIFKTTPRPVISGVPQNLYACDEGNGFAHFDLSGVTDQIVGSQTDVYVLFTDANGNQLSGSPFDFFQNTIPYYQIIHARVMHNSNNLCYADTQFELIVNRLPEIGLEDIYGICAATPSIRLTTNPGFDSWQWLYQDGVAVSNTNVANLSSAGEYTLTVQKYVNGMNCSVSFTFNLVRPQPPVIDKVNFTELSGGRNTIEIVASGDGNLIYSIDGINYYNNNMFTNLDGGVYKVYVKDSEGCGLDWREVILLDYPKFFTPNNDGDNDFWQIAGIRKFPFAAVYIYDRYGKLLAQLTPQSYGWDGQFKDRKLPADDYWFTADLQNGNYFRGHFSLIR